MNLVLFSAARRAFLPLALIALALPALAQKGASPEEWRHHSGDNGSTHYSPLDQINKDNVKDLKEAWRWASIDNTENPKEIKGSYRNEVAPILIGGVIYASTSLSKVVAIEAATGKLIWSYDPQAWKTGRPTNLGFVHRGVAYWQEGEDARIFIATANAHLVAVNAKTGQPCADFGSGGQIDLTQGLRRPVDRKQYACTSPPVVCRNVVVAGSSIFDGPVRKEMPPGDIRGYDVRTGKLLWTFHTVAQPGEFGHDTWEDGSWEYTGNANPWMPLSADDDLGYFYIPVGTPTNDWYGGHRPGNGLFGESLLCLKAETGERVWHFQMVHHGVWDYDPPCAPVLMDLNVDGKAIKAVAQATKQGFVFTFNRETGEPVWPIEERPVPASTVPGEKLSPTQPHPTKPAPYERQGVTENDLVDWTPELRAKAIEILKKYDHGPLFTPPTVKGTIYMPGWQGGANFCGVAFDPETNRLFVPSITDPIRVALTQPDPSRSNFSYTRSGSMGIEDLGEGKATIPIFKPPYGRITAIDMNKGEHLWMIAHGKGPKDNPLIKDLNPPDLGVPARGGVMVTKTLLFAVEAAGGMGGAIAGNEPKLRAIDKDTGAILHEMDLPSFAGASPMTYLAGGKQYIVIAIGGGAKAPQEFVALSLP